MSLGWPVLGKRALDDGLYAKLAWKDCVGLVEPVVPIRGSVIDTYGGANRVQTGPHAYDARQLSLVGYLLNSPSGYNEAWQDAHDFFKDVYGRPAWLQIGSLVLDVEVNPPKASSMRAHRRAFDWALDAEAVPATWRSIGGYLTGTAQEMYVVDDSPARSEYALTNNPIEFTNPGTAVTEAAVSISGLTASTNYWLRNVSLNTPAKIRIRTDANGAVYVASVNGLLLMPGSNWLRIEDDTGADVGGARNWGFHDTVFRYLGNSGNKFNQYPLLHHYCGYKRILATADSGTSLTTYGIYRAGIGVPLGTWTAAKGGLVLEGAGTQYLLASEDFSDASWASFTYESVTVTVNDAAAPDGTTTADKLNDTNNAQYQSRRQNVTIANDSTWWTGSVYLKKLAGAPTTFPMIVLSLYGGTQQYIYLRINLQTGVTYVETSVGNYQVNTYSVGDYWRLCIAVQNNSTGNTTATMEIYPAYAATIDGAADATQTGSLHAWGANLFNDPFPTSYIPSGASGTFGRYWNRAGFYVPRNYLKQSRDLTSVTLSPTTTGPWVRNANCTVARNVTALDGTLLATTVTLVTAGGWIYQAVTPDVRPNLHVWNAVFVLKRGTLTGTNNFRIQIEDQAGVALVYTQISGNELSSDDWTAWSVTAGTADIPINTTGFRITLIGNTGTGTVLVDSVTLTRGPVMRHPLTTLTAQSLPLEGYCEWVESMSQNGYVEFKALLPPRNTGKQAFVFGDNWADESHIQLFRAAATAAANNYLTIVRKHNAGSVNIPDIDVGNVWNDAMHHYRIQWRNYTDSTGTQIMDLRLDIDGVNKYDSSNVVSSTVTSWSVPSRFWLSDGSVYAVIRELKIGTPQLPQGATAN